jgi:hypothetical protein
MGNIKAIKTILKEQQEDEGCDKQAALRDILTDIRHLCDEFALDFYEALNGSYEVYLEEKIDREAQGKGR